MSAQAQTPLYNVFLGAIFDGQPFIVGFRKFYLAIMSIARSGHPALAGHPDDGPLTALTWAVAKQAAMLYKCFIGFGRPELCCHGFAIRITTNRGPFVLLGQHTKK